MPDKPFDAEAEAVAKEARRLYRADPAVPAVESFWTASHFLAVKKAVAAALASRQPEIDAAREEGRRSGLAEGAQIAHEYAEALNIRGQRLLKEGFHNQQILDQQAGAAGAGNQIERALAQRPGAEEK